MRTRLPIGPRLCLVACLLAPVTVFAADAVDPARQLLLAAIRASAMRPVPEQGIQAEAARIAASLTAEQRSELLAGTLAPGELLGRWPSTLRQSADLRSLTAGVIGDAESDLLFVPLAPCRIIDTRFAAGGLVAANTTRNFLAAGVGFGGQGGEGGDCGVPLGISTPIAAAVAINFVAVGPLGPGNLRAWEFNQPIPNASVVNYSNVGGLNIANAVIVPIAGISSQPSDISVRADVSGTHLVADVTGYFTRFPVERVKTTVTTTGQAGTVSLADGACHEIITCTVTAPVAGRVVITANSTAQITHAVATADRLSMGIETDNPATCALAGVASELTAKLVIPAAYPSFTSEVFFVALTNNLPITAGATTTYRITGKMFGGAGSDDAMTATRVTCLFVPD